MARRSLSRLFHLLSTATGFSPTRSTPPRKHQQWRLPHARQRDTSRRQKPGPSASRRLQRVRSVVEISKASPASPSRPGDDLCTSPSMMAVGSSSVPRAATLTTKVELLASKSDPVLRQALERLLSREAKAFASRGCPTSLNNSMSSISSPFGTPGPTSHHGAMYPMKPPSVQPAATFLRKSSDMRLNRRRN
ncbi:hypothetical protein HDK90DRAFT_462393 [Phyllosticta capitalensis]|uniref:Uncharacterized protein n=1 Tax=Phyllosticta capitalensis TaxID=121624 RepID=A0ABR1YXK4_9PEZI